MTKGAHLKLAQAVGLALALILAAGSVAPGALEARAGLRETHPTTAGTEADPPADTTPAVDADWWSTVQEEIRRSEYHVTWQEGTYLADVAAAYQAPNRAHNLRTYFTPQGPVVIPRTGIEAGEAPPWRWQASLVAWGRVGALAPVPEASLEAQESRIEYRRGEGLLEWYRNDDEGLAQGFTLSGPPASGQPGEPVQIQLELGGDLIAVVTESGVDLELHTAAGPDALRYGALRASDAGGTPLPAWLSLDGSLLSVRVDDASAVYPVKIELAIRGLPPTAEWGLTFGSPASEFGTSAATAGDVDRDGYSDVIVGAPNYDAGEEDEGGVFVYYGSSGGLYTFADWYKTMGQGGAHFGDSVATAGDVNGDGYADVIVGAPDYTDEEEREGRIWVWHGSAGGLQDVPAKEAEGNQAYAAFGNSVATAGDVNGDGYADVIVGAPLYSNGQTEEGRVWVWHGSATGLQSFNWRAEGNLFEASFGQAVATAGDINADGYADIIVGASRYTDGQEWEGAAFVWLGSSTGVNGGVYGAPINAHRHLQVNAVTARFGWSVSTAGDVNGDGYADVLVGAPYYTNGQGGEGGAWLYLGSAGGLNATAANHDEGNQDGAHFGWSVGTAGDVNGDGRADVIVGAPDYTVSLSQQGRAFVWHGQDSTEGISTLRDWDAAGEQAGAHFGTSVFTAGDVNGDGYSDVLVGAPGHASSAGKAYVFHGAAGTLNETVGWPKPSNQAGALFGTSVGTAGDVNGDGYADVIVGAPRWDSAKENEGGAWVYLGQAAGLATAPHFYKRSNNAGAEFGASVGTAGDVNGDGYDDIIVGAPGWNVPEVDEGGAFVYPGSADGLDQDAGPLWSKDSDQAGARFGAAVGTAGDVNGDGYMDIIVGAPKWQSGGEERGGIWLYYGSDTGPHIAPDWYTRGDQAQAEYGYAVATAGDVNRDGYSDVIVGSPRWEDDPEYPSEGRAWAYLGSATGLRYDVHWHAEGNSFNAQLGHAVGTAGDVNGDGFSDVIVGAPYYNGGLEGEGRVWVFHGSAGGLESDASWYKEGGQTSAHYGWSVGTAGDVNGDGYADVIIGIEGWSGGQSFEGAASVYHGGWGGLDTTWSWRRESDQTSAHYGTSVGTAGDVNGDGYADAIVGAPLYQTSSDLLDEGQAFLYYGNDGPGVSLCPRQVRIGSGAPIAHLGLSDDISGFRIYTSMRTPFGRGALQQQFEVKPLGTSFDGSQALWWGYYDNLTPGTDYYVTTGGLSAGVPYHWRIRLRYDPATTPWMPSSRWVTMPWNGWNEQDLRLAGSRVLLPLVVREYP